MAGIISMVGIISVAVQGPTCVLGFEYVKKSHCRFAYLEIQNVLPVIRRVQVGTVRFRLSGISSNTAKMKYVI